MTSSAWLRAAAVYNLVWGLGAIVLVGPLAWKVVGLLVLAYAPAYWWAAADPPRHGHLVAVGLLGKALGVAGFAAGAASGAAPVSLGLVVLTNDLIWLPAFAWIVWDSIRESGSWARFLAGR